MIIREGNIEKEKAILEMHCNRWFDRNFSRNRKMQEFYSERIKSNALRNNLFAPKLMHDPTC